jgi:hypothetical protein
MQYSVDYFWVFFSLAWLAWLCVAGQQICHLLLLTAMLDTQSTAQAAVRSSFARHVPALLMPRRLSPVCQSVNGKGP